MAALHAREVSIGDRTIGGGAPCFVVVEAGVNHNGDLSLAEQLVDAAAVAGADAVKFQTFRAEAVASAAAAKAEYQVATTGADGTQLEMLRRLELDAAAHRALKQRADERGIVFLSTPFDSDSLALLAELPVVAFKVSSTDVTNLSFLEEMGGKGRPVLLSTGLSTLGEVEEAVTALRRGGASGIVALQCVSDYPARAEDQNLRAMATMRERLNVPVGFSDHTEGVEVSLAAVALGAAVLEKHLTLDRSLPGPDHAASLEPDELTALVASVRRVEGALGSGVKEPAEGELRNLAAVRRSLAAAVDLPAGTVLERRMLVPLRPGTGISPARLDQVVGRRLRRSVAARVLLDPSDLE